MIAVGLGGVCVYTNLRQGTVPNIDLKNTNKIENSQIQRINNGNSLESKDFTQRSVWDFSISNSLQGL